MRSDGTYDFRPRAASEPAFDAQGEFLAESQRRRKKQTVSKER